MSTRENRDQIPRSATVRGDDRRIVRCPRGNLPGAFASAAGPALASPAFTAQNVSGIEELAAGQTVHVEVLQGSGASLNARIIRFEIAFVGR